MIKQALGIGLLMLSFNGLQAQQIKFEEYDLPNGLHVILQEDHSNPLVTTSVLYHVGSKNENTGRTGFAHFFEHLMFEGSENMKRGDFDKYCAEAGGYNNANTTQDRTYYYETFPSNQLALGLWLESERMMHATVDQKGIDTQREVVKEEKRLRYDNQPYMTALFAETFKLLFKEHPYKNTVIGSMEDLNAAQEVDYKDFYATFYVPNNATLSIAGDIDIAQAKKLVNDYFAPIPKGKNAIPRPNVVEKSITQEIISNYDDKNAQIPAVILAYRTPKETDKDAYILDVISNVLFSGESSRIQKEVVNKKQLAVGTGKFLISMEDYGVFLLYGLPMQGKDAKEMQAAIDEEIEKLKKDGITATELQKQINNLEKSFVDKNSTTTGVAENLANYHVYYGDTNLINQELNIYKSIATEDVKRVANQYLNKNQRVVINVKPVNQ